MSLLSRIERYRRTTGMAETTFGRLAVHDPRLIEDMRNGRQLRPGTRARVEAMLDGR